jgi:hypothetical protein
MKWILVVICLSLIGVIAYVGDCNHKAMQVIETQQEALQGQREVIEQLSGIHIPEGSVAVPMN